MKPFFVLESLVNVELAELPDVHSLGEDRLTVFWVLAAASRTELKCLSATEISDILREQLGIALSWQRVQTILLNEKATIARIGRGSPARFALMKKGFDELLGGASQPLFIDPGRALSSIRAAEGILAECSGEIRICDPYVSGKTLDYIAPIQKAQSVRLLTENIQDSSRLRRDMGAFAREHQVPLEIRVAQNGQLHDRYLIHSEGMLLIGSSLKDIAKRQSMIVALPANFAQAMTKPFEVVWSSATKFEN